jgi:hypothetical protein
MECTNCDATLPLKARFCPSCGAGVRTWEQLAADEEIGRTSPALHEYRELRARLIECYLNFSISKELSEWLQNLGLPSTGTTQEKLIRLRRHAGSLVLPAESFPRQTIFYLNKYDEDILAEICQELGIDGAGPKDILLSRIYREVGLREGWLLPLSEDARLIITETFLPILKSFNPEKEFYRDCWDELAGVLGEDNVQPHVPQAYGSAMIAVLIPGFFREGQMTVLQSEIKERIGKRSLNRTVQAAEPVTGPG